MRSRVFVVGQSIMSARFATRRLARSTFAFSRIASRAGASQISSTHFSAGAVVCVVASNGFSDSTMSP